jgi:hypothetical protein
MTLNRYLISILHLIAKCKQNMKKLSIFLETNFFTYSKEQQSGPKAALSYSFK